MASLNGNELQPLLVTHTASTNAALVDRASYNEQRAVEVLSFIGILLKSWQIFFRLRGFVLLPLAVLLQAVTYIYMPYAVLHDQDRTPPPVRFLQLVGGALIMTLVRAMEMALAVHVTHKSFQREGSPSPAQISQAYSGPLLASIRRPWQIWRTSVINCAVVYGVLGLGTFFPLKYVLYELTSWWGEHPRPPPLVLALLPLFGLAVLAGTTFLSSTLILALPATIIDGCTSIAANLRSVQLGKGQRLQIFGLVAFSLLFNPLVVLLVIFHATTLHPTGQNWAAVVVVLLGSLSVGPAPAYFQVVWVVAYLSARKREDPTFVWPPQGEASDV